MPTFKYGLRRYSNDEIAAAIAAAHHHFEGKRCAKGRHPVYAKAAEILGCSISTINSRFCLRSNADDIEFQARKLRAIRELATLELPA